MQKEYMRSSKEKRQRNLYNDGKGESQDDSSHALRELALCDDRQHHKQSF